MKVIKIFKHLDFFQGGDCYYTFGLKILWSGNRVYMTLKLDMSWYLLYNIVCCHILQCSICTLNKCFYRCETEFFFFFLAVLHGFWDLSSSIRDQPGPMAVKVLSLNHWTTSLFSSVQVSRSVRSNSLRPHEPQHVRPPCPSPTPRVHPNSCTLSRWCHPTISSSVVPFSSCP